MSFSSNRSGSRSSRGSGNSGNDKRRGSGYSRGGGSGGSRHRNHDQQQSRQPKTPIILAKPNHDRVIAREFESNDSQAQEWPGPRSILSERRPLLARKDSGQVENSGSVTSSRSSTSGQYTDSPRSQSSSTANGVGGSHSTRGTKNNTVEDFVPPRNVKLVDDQQYCDALDDYMTENTDFLVVGMLGAQSVGKSLLLNHMLSSLKSLKMQHEHEVPLQTLTNVPPPPIPTNHEAENGLGNENQTNGHTQRMFRVQTFEKQMLSEHCTNGVNAWISPQRILYLDSQPLFSNSVMDRAAQLEKKFSGEFNGAEITTEIHSLQLSAFFMNICHLVIIVQEGAIVDTELIERLKNSELLRPSSKGADDPGKHAEYSPELLFVHNKVDEADLNTQVYQQLREDYEKILGEASFIARMRTGLSNDGHEGKNINLILVPDIENSNEHAFPEAIKALKRTLYQLQPQPFQNNIKGTEKNWLQYAKKNFDQAKASNFYLEYSRLLRYQKS